MIDTLRLLITLDCNLDCSYCCNKLPEVQARFKHMPLDQIDWSKYKNVCISGGEPLLRLCRLIDVLDMIPGGKKIYLYTNGIMLDFSTAAILLAYSDLKAINIGIHFPTQARILSHMSINRLELNGKTVRFQVQDNRLQETLALNSWLKSYEIKPWKLNDCLLDNEDVVVLTEQC